MNGEPLPVSNLPNFPVTKDILRSLRHPNIICALVAAEFTAFVFVGCEQFQWYIRYRKELRYPMITIEPSQLVAVTSQLLGLIKVTMPIHNPNLTPKCWTDIVSEVTWVTNTQEEPCATRGPGLELGDGSGWFPSWMCTPVDVI